MSDDESAAGNKFDVAKKVALGGALVTGAAIAFSTFWSTYDSGTRRKRKLSEVIPGAIDSSATALKRVLSAMDAALSTAPDAPPDGSGRVREQPRLDGDTAVSRNGPQASPPLLGGAPGPSPDGEIAGIRMAASPLLSGGAQGSSAKHAVESDAVELTTKGYAYGRNAACHQWFVARWQRTNDSSVRVEYLSTMDGNTSSLALPSQKKTTIPSSCVREDAPANAFEAPAPNR